MPPTPSADTISYGPRRSPGARRMQGVERIIAEVERLTCGAQFRRAQSAGRGTALQPCGADGYARAWCSAIIHDSSLAEVAERQTHQLEGLAIARSWRFESSLPHH